jgi:RNA polymerase sigma-70 factor (ECF subfamily)
MGQVGITIDGASAEAEGRSGDGPVATTVRELVDAHYAFIWRSLRRLGVASADVDDAVQRVFLTVSRKLARIRPGSEKSYLFQTALRVAADSRRTVRRRREVAEDADGPPAVDPVDTEQIVDLVRARARLDTILDGMAIELRAVFVLYELDEMPTPEIALLLGVPVGTVSSRLRRARAEFSAQVARLQRSEGARPGDVR